MEKFLRQHWMLCAIVVLSFLVYINTINNDFVHWDDIDQIIDNPDIRALNWSTIRSMFTKSYVNMYQPLVTLSFAVERSLFGTDPRVYHFTNLFFHLLNILLVYAVIHRIVGHQPTALFAALIFAIHPMHVESVAWVTERKDVLYTFFYLSALLLFIRFENEQQQKWYWWSLGVYLMSLLSKSAAVTLPAALVLIRWYWQKQWTMQGVFRLLPYLVLAIIFGIISLITQQPQQNDAFFQSYTLIDRLLISLYPIAFYALKYVVPFGLSVFHPFPIKIDGLLPWHYYVAPVVVLLLGLLLLLRWEKSREVKFSLGWFLIHIALYLHLFPVGSAVAAERYTYVAYIGLSVLMAQTAVWLLQHSRLKYILALLLCLITASFSFISHNRVKIWNNTIVLFDDALEKTGHTETTGNMLCLGYLSKGVEKLTQGDTITALSLFDKAIFFDSTYYGRYEQRDRIYFKQRQFQQALTDISNALKYSTPEVDITALYELRGLAYLRTQQYDKSVKDFIEILQYDSLIGRIYANRGIAFIHLNKREDACNDFQKALSIGFRNVIPLMNEYCNKNTGKNDYENTSMD